MSLPLQWAAYFFVVAVGTAAADVVVAVVNVDDSSTAVEE